MTDNWEAGKSPSRVPRGVRIKARLAEERLIRKQARDKGSLSKAADAAIAFQAAEAGNTDSATRVTDSFQNFALQLGIGTDNALAASGYGFNPITRVRTLLEWIHRGSWLGGVAVDLVADDMTKMGIDIMSTLPPDQINKLQSALLNLGVWGGINDTIKWSRLYGGALGVMLIDGQDLSQPLRVDRIGKGQFKGILSLDRWMVEPMLIDLVTDYGPQIGCPRFYRVTSDAPALNLKVIHYSRCLRLEGIRLPYWQRVMENLWGISVLERLYDRMIAFDSATQGAAQLVHKMFIRIFKVKGLREIASSNTRAFSGLLSYVEFMRSLQSNEGITLIDMNDDYVPHQQTVNTGISAALEKFGEQLCGALQIPAVRLFGMSPSGLNSTGESDLRMYYDNIGQQQEKHLKVPMTTIMEVVARSEGIRMPEGWELRFKPLWQMTEEQKAAVAGTDTTTVSTAEERGLISPKVAMQELRQSSRVTGRFSNITDKDINEAEDEAAPPPDGMEGEEGGDNVPGAKPKPSKPDREGAPKVKDTFHLDNSDWDEFKSHLERKQVDSLRRLAIARDALPISEFHGIPVVIECTKGHRRWSDGPAWPADYGYIRKTRSAEGADECVDCFIGPNRESTDVWIFNHHTDEGAFEEHKVMLGYASQPSAMDDYYAAYGWEPKGEIDHMSCDQVMSFLLNVNPMVALEAQT